MPSLLQVLGFFVVMCIVFLVVRAASRWWNGSYVHGYIMSLDDIQTMFNAELAQNTTSEELRKEREKAISHLMSGKIVAVNGPVGREQFSLIGWDPNYNFTREFALKVLENNEKVVGGATSYELLNW